MIETRQEFENSRNAYEQLISAGCQVSGFARTCIKNADNATTNSSKEFEEQRETVMTAFIDAIRQTCVWAKPLSLGKATRLTSAPI